MTVPKLLQSYYETEEKNKSSMDRILGKPERIVTGKLDREIEKIYKIIAPDGYNYTSFI